jgi:transcriptional regulator with XRE-family HTH domain
MNASASALGKEIRYQRRLAGLSQKEVAARVGVTGVQLHRYEVGATCVTTSRLINIASAIGVRPDVLLNAATTPPQMQASMDHGAGAAGDLAAFLETFMTIQDPAHRDALLAVARMMSLPSQQSTARRTNTAHGQNGTMGAVSA